MHRLVLRSGTKIPPPPPFSAIDAGSSGLEMSSARKDQSRLESLARLAALLFLTSSSLSAFTPVEWRGQKSHVTGIIRDVSGEPLAGAKVSGGGMDWTADGLSATLRTFETHTDSVGAYRLDLPAGADGVWVEHPDRARFPGGEVLAQGPIEPGEHRVDHQFRPLLHVRGIVLGPDSLPAPKGTVVYYSVPEGSAICGTGLPQVSLVQGSFEVFLQHPGPYYFAANLSDRAFGMPGYWPRIQVNGDTTITIRVGGISVEGTVRGYGDLPLGATVTAEGAQGVFESVADSQGHFRISVSEDRYSWRVQPFRREFQRWRTTVPGTITRSTSVELSLNTVRWTGRVRNSQTGEDLDSVRIYSWETERESWVSGADCLTGPNGEFRLYVRRGGRFDLSLVDEKHARVAVPVSMSREDIDRKYSRVFGRKLTEVPAIRDSTFDITMEPVKK